MALRSELVTFCKTGGVGGVVLVILFHFNQNLFETFEIIPFEIFAVTKTHALDQPRVKEMLKLRFILFTKAPSSLKMFEKVKNLMFWPKAGVMNVKELG